LAWGLVRAASSRRGTCLHREGVWVSAWGAAARVFPQKPQGQVQKVVRGQRAITGSATFQTRKPLGQEIRDFLSRFFPILCRANGDQQCRGSRRRSGSSRAQRTRAPCPERRQCTSTCSGS